MEWEVIEKLPPIRVLVSAVFAVSVVNLQ